MFVYWFIINFSLKHFIVQILRPHQIVVSPKSLIILCIKVKTVIIGPKPVKKWLLFIGR